MAKSIWQNPSDLFWQLLVPSRPKCLFQRSDFWPQEPTLPCFTHSGAMAVKHLHGFWRTSTWDPMPSQDIDEHFAADQNISKHCSNNFDMTWSISNQIKSLFDDPQFFEPSEVDGWRFYTKIFHYIPTCFNWVVFFYPCLSMTSNI